MSKTDAVNPESYLDLNLDAVEELKIYEDGTEVKMRIESATMGPGKTDPNKLVIGVTLVDPVDDTMQYVKTYFVVPSKEMEANDKRTADGMKRRIKNFCKTFGINTSGGFQPEVDFPGCEGYVMLGVENDPQYGDKNYVKKYM